MKILIADDHKLFLTALQMTLNDHLKNVEIVCANDYTEVFDAIKKNNNFDLVLTDLAMPGARWLDAIERIHQDLPSTPIIILSAVFDKDIVQKTLEIGAAGYIPKTASSEVIISAVNLVMSGGVYIPAELLRDTQSPEIDILKAAENIKSDTSKKSDINCLSPRQIDVLKLIALGKSNKQIAYELGLTEGTVKLHVTAILKLMHVYNRTGAATLAKDWGLLKQND